ncbi:uncharacterized protein LOC141852654 [Brevipalpus obovatus]|uniref:uncharacterized protein LOC141852654 n=1 Tax=Brevipalpus obovatus TaxID=246614 RepID=UPI003D9F2718
MASIVDKDLYFSKGAQKSDSKTSATTSAASKASEMSIGTNVNKSEYEISNSSERFQEPMSLDRPIEDLKFKKGVKRGAHLDSIAWMSTNKHVLLGSSNVAGHMAFGYLQLYGSPQDAVNEKNCSISADYAQGPITQIIANDKVFLEKFIVGFRSGLVSLFDSNLSFIKKLQPDMGRVTDLKLNSDHSKVVYSNSNGSIALIDMKDFVTEKYFHQAHCSSVMGVDFLAGKSDQFLSIGQECSIYQWDLRQSKPASRFTELETSGTSIKCCIREEFFVTGDIEGSVKLFDIRKPGEELVKFSSNLSRIHRIKSLGQDDSRLGAVGNEDSIAIFKDHSLKLSETYIIETDIPVVRDFFVNDEKTIFVVGCECKKVVPHKVPL